MPTVSRLTVMANTRMRDRILRFILVLLMYFFRGSPRLGYSFCWRFVHNRCALTQRPTCADRTATARRTGVDLGLPTVTLGALPPYLLMTSEGNVSSRKRRVANLVPLRQQSPMALLYAKVVERCSHPCSPLASDPPGGRGQLWHFVYRV